MNGKALIPLAAGLGIGGFALWMGFNTLKSAQGAQKPVAETQVWGAQTDIPRGTEITEDMIGPLRFPASLVPKGALTDKEKLIGRVPRVDAAAGLPILDDMLLPAGTRPGIFVKSGYRAVAVQIDSGSGVDYHLEPGCFVDVVGSFSVRRPGAQQETLARTIIENVEVAAVGPWVSAVRRDRDEEGSKGDRKVRAVTLFVRPEDVPKLLLAEQKGRIKLSLRSDDDGNPMAARKPVSDLELTGEKAPVVEEPVAAQPPSASFLGQLRQLLARASKKPRVSKVWEVAVYRGQELETLRFKDRDSRELVPEGAYPAPAGESFGSPADEDAPVEPRGQQNSNEQPEPKEPQE